MRIISIFLFLLISTFANAQFSGTEVSRDKAAPTLVGFKAANSGTGDAGFVAVKGTDSTEISLRGVLVSKKTAAEIALISNPGKGLIVYQTDGASGLYYFNGTAWMLIGSGSAITGPPTEIPYFDNAGNVSSDAGFTSTDSTFKVSRVLNGDTLEILISNNVAPGFPTMILRVKHPDGSEDLQAFGFGLISNISQNAAGANSSYDLNANEFVVQTSDGDLRSGYFTFSSEQGISCQIHYPSTLHTLSLDSIGYLLKCTSIEPYIMTMIARSEFIDLRVIRTSDYYSQQYIHVGSSYSEMASVYSDNNSRIKTTGVSAYISAKSLTDSSLIEVNGNVIYLNSSNIQLSTLPPASISDGYVMQTASGELKLSPSVSSINNTAVLDFGSISSNSYADLAMTVSGAADGDVVTIGVPGASVPGGVVFFAWVSAANTVTIRCQNGTAGSVDPDSGTFKAIILR